MEYIGMQEQISRNNRKSVLLLVAFPVLVLLMVYAVVFFMNFDEQGAPTIEETNQTFIPVLIPTIIVVGIWFVIAYFSHSSMINSAARSKSLERKENKRVYNLTENLCMSVGMPMPNLRIIESPALNAFASGLNQKSYTVTLTRGIIEKLDDDELEGVIAHELMHIRNKDVRLLIVTIIFVGIFSFVVQVAFRSVLYGGTSRNRRKDDGKGMIIILVIALVAYLLSILFKFSLSRKREYLADTGAAQMTKKPDALASALEKISRNHHVDAVKSEDIQQMFIENAPEDTSANLFGGLRGLFSTHPPIEKRIQILRQF
ncbi:MAG: M48 family metallopeptidase [Brumimicrobium sp.]|nr:M48 family metallopeptidase [Brumimicrobium sp.]